MDKKYFTIVVPIYNVERFLDACLNSLVKQTNKNFVAILVDDGSTDNSSIIAKKFARKYPKTFKYIRQQNKGLGGARNTGIAQVKTDYMLFLDSDDFLSINAIENLEKFIRNLKTKPDIILTYPIIYNSISKNYTDFYDRDKLDKIFANRISTNSLIDPKIMSTEASVWRCIWSTSFWNKSKVIFAEHMAWEDVIPHFVLFHKAQSIVRYKDSPVFFYRINSGKQITSNGGKIRLDVPKVFGSVIEIAKKEKWRKDELVYLIDYMQKFIMWSIHDVQHIYRKQFIRSSHELYKKISYFLLFRYYRCCKPKFSAFIAGIVLKSALFHKILYKHYKTEIFHRIFSKIFRRR